MERNTVAGSWASLSDEDYLRNRVDDQIAWLETKSASNKTWYFRLQIFTLITAASIPVVSLALPEEGLRLVVALLGSMTMVAAGITTLFQFKDQWMDYRATVEALKYEKYLFLTGSNPYENGNAFSLFTNRIESILSEENINWQKKEFSTASKKRADSADQGTDNSNIDTVTID